MERVGIFVLFLALGEKLSALSMMLAVGFLCTLCQPEDILSITSLLRVFIMKGCWVLSDAFSVTIVMIMQFFTLILLIWCVILTGFHMLSQFCISEINTTWPWYLMLFMCCWIQFACILLRVIVYVLIRDIGL